MGLEVIKKRVEKDLRVTISVTTNKNYVSLVGRNLQLVMRTPLNKGINLPFEIVEEYKVQFNFRGKQCGVHTFTIYENRDKKSGATAVDVEKVIEIVPKTYMENDAKPEGLDIEEVDLGTSDMEVVSSAGIYSKSIKKIEVQTLDSYTNLPVIDEKTLYVLIKEEKK